jgi:hypothetical protein
MFWIWLIQGRCNVPNVAMCCVVLCCVVTQPDCAYSEAVVFEWLCVWPRGMSHDAHVWVLELVVLEAATGLCRVSLLLTTILLLLTQLDKSRTFPNRQQASSERKYSRPRLWQGVLTDGQLTRKLKVWESKNKNKNKVCLCSERCCGRLTVRVTTNLVSPELCCTSGVRVAGCRYRKSLVLIGRPLPSPPT